MTTPGSSTLNHLTGKRGACDRCRGQKLRCIRDDQNQNSPQATCIRCFKARATCSYGTAKRAGRSPPSSISFPEERRGTGSGKPKIGSLAARSTANPSGQTGFVESEADTWQDRRGTGHWSNGRLLEEYTVDQESEGETANTSPIHAQSPSSQHDSSNVLSGVHLDFASYPSSSTTTLPWPEETMPVFSNHDAEEASCLEPFGSMYSWAFQDYRAQLMDIQVPKISQASNCEQPGDAAVNAYGIPAQEISTDAQITGGSDEAMDVDLLATSAHKATFDPTSALDARPRRVVQDTDRECVRLSNSSGTSPTANPRLFKDVPKIETGIKLDQSSPSINEIQHRRMQELSKLAMDLYAQLATNDPENHQPTSGATATTFQDQLVGSVLKSSNTFLTLLSSFSTPVTPSSPFPSSPPASSMSHNNPTYDSSDNGSSPLASALEPDDHAMDEAVQNSYGKVSAGSSDDSQPSPPIDMATVLQLLTCYIRITHLHSIMHARILDYLFAYLQHKPQHVGSVPPVFPNMQVGGVSLNRFGTFQVQLLLQISVHVLGEIESALGLPKEFRVGKSTDGGRTGVLGASVSWDFVKCLMSEGAWRGKKVESVREQLANLKRVLKRAMAF